MGSYSKIEWTTHTFNPWWGCTKVSSGCKHCYAETLSNRYGFDVWGPGKSRRLMSDQHWKAPLLWNRQAEKDQVRSRVFCASMADVFEDQAPDGQLERLWDLIRITPNLDWQLLTKRPEKIADLLPADWGDGYPNVWIGTSIEDQKVVDRIQLLTNVPASIHFLSIEPLIGPIVDLPLHGIDWVIVGGESGQNPRPMRPEWVRAIHQACIKANVPFFFKQWGGSNKKAAGRELDGHYYDELPRQQMDMVLRSPSRLAEACSAI